jgi:hexokinase
MLEGLKSSSVDILRDFLADCMAEFIYKYHLGMGEVLPLAFNFSFLAT